MSAVLHTPQITGKNHGRPWCEASGETVITEDDDAVTCPDCREHLRFCGALSVGTIGDIDFFGGE